MVPSIENTMTPPDIEQQQHDGLDFQVIDSVYGRNSDLYHDVLDVSPSASRGEIRAAFVDSRDEFFQFSQEVENGNVVVTEGQLDFSRRRMDAVVAAFRILHDPASRKIYDRIREKRLHVFCHKNQKKQDPIVQAVHRALVKNPSKIRGASPFETSSGNSTASEASYECRDVSRQQPKNKKRGGSRYKREASAIGGSAMATAPSYYMDEQTPPHTPRAGGRYFSNKGTAAASQFSSLLVADDESVHSADIGSSRNYYHEQMMEESHNTASSTGDTTAMDDDETLETHRESNTLRRSRVDADDETTVMSYMYDDDTMAMEEDITQVCCSSSRQESKDLSLFSHTRRVIRAIKTEIRGSLNDTSSAMDQVLNAFTLQDQDIRAVTSRIDKVSKQLAS